MLIFLRVRAGWNNYTYICMTGLRGETLVTLKPTPRHLTQSRLSGRVTCRRIVIFQANGVCVSGGGEGGRAIQWWIHLISRGQTEFFFLFSSSSPTRCYIRFGPVVIDRKKLLASFLFEECGPIEERETSHVMIEYWWIRKRVTWKNVMWYEFTDWLFRGRILKRRESMHTRGNGIEAVSSYLIFSKTCMFRTYIFDVMCIYN